MNFFVCFFEIILLSQASIVVICSVHNALLYASLTLCFVCVCVHFDEIVSEDCVYN